MSTLEERFAELERMLSVLRREQVNTNPLEEQIHVLQQQLAEQQRRLSTQEQNTGQLGLPIDQRFDRLEKILTYQFNAINPQFIAINTRFDAQTAAIRAQFEDTNMQVARVMGLVDQQEKDIREIKERVDHLGEKLDHVDQRMESGFEAIDKRFSTLESHFGAQGQLLHQILECLPKQK